MVHRYIQLPIPAGGLDMGHLYAGRRDVPFMRGSLFGRCGTRGEATWSVEAHVLRITDGHRAGINISQVPHVVHGPVVEERAVIPISTLIADTRVAEAVIDAAVESHMGTPVALVKNEEAAVPSPITRCPEQARLGNQYPDAGHPEVPIIVGPIPGFPNVSGARANGLHIHWQGRRCKSDREDDSCRRYRRRGEQQKSQQGKREQNRTAGENVTHLYFPQIPVNESPWCQLTHHVSRAAEGPKRVAALSGSVLSPVLAQRGVGSGDIEPQEAAPRGARQHNCLATPWPSALWRRRTSTATQTPATPELVIPRGGRQLSMAKDLAHTHSLEGNALNVGLQLGFGEIGAVVSRLGLTAFRIAVR